MEYVKGLLRMCLQIARRLDYIILYLFFCILKPVKKNNILMLSDSRAELTGNLAFIDRELKSRGFQPVYYLKPNLKAKKSVIEKVKMCRSMAEAQDILVDDFYPIIYPIPLRKQTRLIQVWHAVGAYKKVGFSRPGRSEGAYRFSLTHRNYTDVIVSSEEIRQCYAEAFRKKIEQIHATGVPRTDLFFDKEYERRIKEKYYQRYPQMREKKVILFAPTFRGDDLNKAYYPYELMDFQRMRDTFNDDYICIVKMHPAIKQMPDGLNPDFYLDLSEEREINDLLLLTDILITDYSSVIFEAAIRKIQTVFYVPDLDEYAEAREFYYPFETYCYGAVAKTMDQMISAVSDGANDEERRAEFLNRFCSACDGQASKRFANTFWGRQTFQQE